MINKDKIIETATRILAEMYDIPEIQLRTVGKRTKIIMGARRMFIFYLNRHLRIKHHHMKKYIEGINHATSIHHCNKMEFLLSMVDKKDYSIYYEEYKEFTLRMREVDNFDSVMLAKNEKMIQLQAEINTYLKTQLNA